MRVNELVGPLKRTSVALGGSEPEELRPVAAMLGEMGYVVRPAETMDELALLLRNEEIGAVLIHVCPSRQEFLSILERPDRPPVIPLIRHADKQMYLSLLRRGAFDCAALPAQKSELKRVVSLAIQEKRQSVAVAGAA